MILVDTNILMYAAGAEHPNKAPCIQFLSHAAGGEIEAAIDAGVLQEIIHRYQALGRWRDGKEVYNLARRLFPNVLPITGEILDRAKQLVDEDTALAARDAVHAAVVSVCRLEGICTYDRDFDRIPGCHRTSP